MVLFFVRPVYASSFDAIFVAVSTAIFVVPALQIQITCVQTTYSFSAISAREIFQSFEHAPNVMQLGSDFQKMWQKWYISGGPVGYFAARTAEYKPSQPWTRLKTRKR